MSLCSLIYNNKNEINSSNELVMIMNIEDQFWLSQSAWQSFLMKSELPTSLNVFNTDYELQFSDSFTGNLQKETANYSYQI